MRETLPPTRTPGPRNRTPSASRGAIRAPTRRRRRSPRAKPRPSHSPLDGAGNGKCKGGARTVIRLCPDTSMMRLDDGATDRQANPHTAGLGRVERFEKFVHHVVVETLPRVLHGEAHPVAGVALGSDHQLRSEERRVGKEGHVLW